MSTQFKIGDVVEVVRPDWGGLAFRVDRVSGRAGYISHVSGMVVQPATAGGLGATQGHVATINQVFPLGSNIGFSAGEVRRSRHRTFGQWYKEHS